MNEKRRKELLKMKPEALVEVIRKNPAEAKFIFSDKVMGEKLIKHMPSLIQLSKLGSENPVVRKAIYDTGFMDSPKLELTNSRALLEVSKIDPVKEKELRVLLFAMQREVARRKGEALEKLDAKTIAAKHSTEQQINTNLNPAEWEREYKKGEKSLEGIVQLMIADPHNAQYFLKKEEYLREFAKKPELIKNMLLRGSEALIEVLEDSGLLNSEFLNKETRGELQEVMRGVGFVESLSKKNNSLDSLLSSLKSLSEESESSSSEELSESQSSAMASSEEYRNLFVKKNSDAIKDAIKSSAEFRTYFDHSNITETIEDVMLKKSLEKILKESTVEAEYNNLMNISDQNIRLEKIIDFVLKDQTENQEYMAKMLGDSVLKKELLLNRPDLIFKLMDTPGQLSGKAKSAQWLQASVISELIENDDLGFLNRLKSSNLLNKFEYNPSGAVFDLMRKLNLMKGLNQLPNNAEIKGEIANKNRNIAEIFIEGIKNFDNPEVVKNEAGKLNNPAVREVFLNLMEKLNADPNKKDEYKELYNKVNKDNNSEYRGLAEKLDAKLEEAKQQKPDEQQVQEYADELAAARFREDVKRDDLDSHLDILRTINHSGLQAKIIKRFEKVHDTLGMDMPQLVQTEKVVDKLNTGLSSEKGMTVAEVKNIIKGLDVVKESDTEKQVKFSDGLGVFVRGTCFRAKTAPEKNADAVEIIGPKSMSPTETPRLR